MNKAMTHVLVIDDDPDFTRLVAWMLNKREYKTEVARTFEDARQKLAQVPVDVILLDRHLTGEDGLTLIRTLAKESPTTPVILVTADSSVEVAIRAIRCGAFDFLPKPMDEGRLLASVTKAAEYRRLLDTVEQLQGSMAESDSYEDIIGAQPQMRTLYRIIENVAPTDTNVMVQGESGTGKELVAKAVHRRSDRRNGPFVALNMAALPKELVESLLFGHEKGAFTGADRRRPGAAEEARGGTLFLDEIGEMPIELQPKLLRFLQERTYRRVGGAEDITADVRIISATNRDPMEEVRAGRLRADLYYRLNVVPIHLPPLRERRGDIPLLAMHALKAYAKRHHKQFETIDQDAMKQLVVLDWPGNVRQLMHTIERIVVLNDGKTLSPPMLPPDLLAEMGGVRDANAEDEQPSPDHAPPNAGMSARATVSSAEDSNGEDRKAANPVSTPDPAAAMSADANITPLAEMEQQAIERAIEICDGSAAQAARRLGISEATIYRKIKSYGQAPPRAARSQA